MAFKVEQLNAEIIGMREELADQNVAILRKNIKAKDHSKIFVHNIDGIILEKEFTGIPHQCNYSIPDAFDPQEILSTLI